MLLLTSFRNHPVQTSLRMSLLKLRTLSSVLHVGHQSFPKYSNLLQNECISPISSTFDSRHLFHSFSISTNDNLLDRTTISSNIIKRNITTGEKEPFLLASMRFFMESPLVQPVENFIIQFHDSVGLHWWSSIVVMTIGARFLVTSPLYVYQVSIMVALFCPLKFLSYALFNLVSHIHYYCLHGRYSVFESY